MLCCWWTCGFAWWLWFPSKNHHWNNYPMFVQSHQLLTVEICMHAIALPSLWHLKGRPGNALDNAGLPRLTHPDNNSARCLFIGHYDSMSLLPGKVSVPGSSNDWLTVSVEVFIFCALIEFSVYFFCSVFMFWTETTSAGSNGSSPIRLEGLDPKTRTRRQTEFLVDGQYYAFDDFPEDSEHQRNGGARRKTRCFAHGTFCSFSQIPEDKPKRKTRRKKVPEQDKCRKHIPLGTHRHHSAESKTCWCSCGRKKPLLFNIFGHELLFFYSYVIEQKRQSGFDVQPIFLDSLIESRNWALSTG